MLWQYLIVSSIVFVSLCITAWKLYQFFINPLHKCNGCAQGCGGCPVDDLKTEIALKQGQKY